ncbi:uncharacterized protein LOC143584608 [Bidens hawaiensis]|uniref:uncharacterized protein LOC143584608 n=1 Tax=Bidens hawaiensis TaxID=980011 RepID=UPI00404B81F2
MIKDAIEYDRRGYACQRHSNVPHQPADPMYPILSLWPFMKWGMDIVGKLPKAPGGKVFMLVMTDYFSKWIEAEAFAQVRDKELGNQNDHIHTSTSASQRAGGIQQQDNCKQPIEEVGIQEGKWAKELPFVLWADRTTSKNATGQTPFSLVFGSEAVISKEMVIPMARSTFRDTEENNEALLQDLDIIDEFIYKAKIRMATHQQRIAKSYNKNLRIRRFQVGDLVLRKTFQNTINPTDEKLAPKWEGPYLIDSEAGKGAYWLANMEGEILPRSWNAVHLKAYFI